MDDLIAPLFVREGIDEPAPILSMPGQAQHTIDSLVVEAKRLVSLGVPGLILFGVPATKNATGTEAYSPDGIVQRALRSLRDAVGDELVLMADLCLDEYTDHGHCGVLGPDGGVHNDPTLELYGRIALAQAAAGVDVVAPSGMMDGQVSAIRAALDGRGHDRSRSSPMRRSTHPRCTALFVTPSTCRSPGAATVGRISRIRTTAARRCSKSRRTSPRARTWSWSSLR